MTKQFFGQWLSLLCIFVVALVMELAPWPTSLHYFKPAWLVLALLYWTLFIPQKVSIGWGFMLGLVWDLILGSVLGIHALILSIATYIIAANHQLLRNLSLWQQSLLVVGYIFIIRLAIFVLEFLIHTADFHWQDILGACISGLLWPWVYLLFRVIGHKLRF
ncbi:MAG: rod shape-determining protein MreD [Lonepinella koalarum]|nr:rod shape-determining protein MreD [Lonepinella koalarum]